MNDAAEGGGMIAIGWEGGGVWMEWVWRRLNKRVYVVYVYVYVYVHVWVSWRVGVEECECKGG